jgi:hypothetical protein
MAASVAACSSSSATSSASSAAPVPTTTAAVSQLRACSAGQLGVSVGHTGTGGGAQWGYLVFRNTGSVACRIAGWPSLVAVRLDGVRRVATRVRADALFGPHLSAPPTVVLAPGAHADAVFGARDNPPRGGSCPTYRYLLVRAPGITRVTRTSAWIGYADAYLAACYRPDIGPVLPSRALFAG